MLFREQEPVDYIYFLREGEVVSSVSVVLPSSKPAFANATHPQLPKTRTLDMARSGPGSLVGEWALLEEVLARLLQLPKEMLTEAKYTNTASNLLNSLSHGNIAIERLTTTIACTEVHAYCLNVVDVLKLFRPSMLMMMAAMAMRRRKVRADCLKGLTGQESETDAKVHTLTLTHIKQEIYKQKRFTCSYDYTHSH